VNQRKTAFVSGHLDLTDEEFQQHYADKISEACNLGHRIVVGDAGGCDLIAQKFLYHVPSEFCDHITVYHMFDHPRNNPCGYSTIGGFQSDGERDEAMTEASDYDIAWVRPGREKSGTAQNILRRTSQHLDFQTPEDVCNLMASFLPDNVGLILEPTSGEGNLVKALSKKGDVFAPVDFFEMEFKRFDTVVMNPPFSPMKLGYKILYSCMEMSDVVIALMPWLTMINGNKRTNDIMNFGLVSITHLPRSIFDGARVQTCILEMRKGFDGDTVFKTYKRKT
jgi:hypothetical protein